MWVKQCGIYSVVLEGVYGLNYVGCGIVQTTSGGDDYELVDDRTGALEVDCVLLNPANMDQRPKRRFTGKTRYEVGTVVNVGMNQGRVLASYGLRWTADDGACRTESNESSSNVILPRD